MAAQVRALPDVDEWGQPLLLDLLLRYCRQNFADPNSAAPRRAGGGRAAAAAMAAAARGMGGGGMGGGMGMGGGGMFGGPPGGMGGGGGPSKPMSELDALHALGDRKFGRKR